ncbi:Uma2 family endonuclease [Pseudogracilibacillus sp. SO30301A]|uniref:Uma2 family endonuclease n=1 Tax=Pseudogracilibacillus sp. SO30301A TaxID=3098291 RepID=UPI00300E34C2
MSRYVAHIFLHPIQLDLHLNTAFPQTLICLLQKKLTETSEQTHFIFYTPIDVILSTTDIRQPDIVLVNRKRIDILTNRGIEGTPDLVIEILSPSSLERDKIDKLKTNAEYMIPEYWIVDPNSYVLEQYLLTNDRYEIINVFQAMETMSSPTITSVSFTMQDIKKRIPLLNNNK